MRRSYGEAEHAPTALPTITRAVSYGWHAAGRMRETLSMESVQLTPDQGSYLAPSFEHATVADAMRRGVAACSPDAPAVDIARLMATRHIHAVIVAGVEHEGVT